MSQNKVTIAEEWVLGLEDIPFFTKRWFPANSEPDAYIVFVHGCADHVHRFNDYFPLLAAHNIHIMAFDQRGHGMTAHHPPKKNDPIVVNWKKEGKRVHLDCHQKHRTGGWAKAIPDLEFFVKRESQRAKGKKLFLYGHSMGGGIALGFATRPHPPPARETVSLLSGVIVSGPYIASTKPHSFSENVQLALSGVLVHVLGNAVIPVPIKVKDLTHDVEVQEKTANDPMCAPYASMRTIYDMVNCGGNLNTPASWNAWPKDLPLLIYHGAEDPICSPEAAVRFGENVAAVDKTTKLLPGLLHEPHLELPPAPQEVADEVSSWIHKRAGGATTTAPAKDATAKL